MKIRGGLLRGVLQRLRSLRTDETGSVTIEFVLMVPLLYWCFLISWDFFRAYRADLLNVKAAYTIGDQVSREQGIVGPSYIAGIGELHKMLVQYADQPRLRVTALSYVKDEDSYVVIWSGGVGVSARVNGAEITDIKQIMPKMGENDVHVLTESWIDFIPYDYFVWPKKDPNDPTQNLEKRLGTIELYEAIVTKSRVNRICWKDSPTAPDSTALC
jgi:hypothetical protein